MVLIKDILDGLSDIDRRTLMYAFENNITHVVKLEDGYYVGVNMSISSNFQELQKVGVWSYGRLQ